jgi:hypothetical protein
MIQDARNWKLSAFMLVQLSILTAFSFVAQLNKEGRCIVARGRGIAFHHYHRSLAQSAGKDFRDDMMAKLCHSNAFGSL